MSASSILDSKMPIKPGLPRDALKMTEQQLLDATVELAQTLRWRVAHFRPARTVDGWRTPVSADGKGFPDLVMVRDRLLFVELKSMTGKLTTSQHDWGLALENGGAEFHVWNPEHWRDGSIERELTKRAIGRQS